MTLVHEERMRRAKADAARYEDDAYTWALQQAALLRGKQTEGLDWINLADEITDVGRHEYDKLESALARILQHLLKWDHQAERRSRSWALSIEAHRALAAHQLADHPGLKSTVIQAVARGYERGRLEALDETGLPRSALPETCPYDWSEIMERDIPWPDE